MTIEQIALFSKEIVDAKQNVASIESQIERLNKGICFTAKLTLEIGERKYPHKYFLSRSEVAPILETRLLNAKSNLEEAEEKFEDAKHAESDPSPIVDTSENIDQTKAVITANKIIKDEL